MNLLSHTAPPPPGVGAATVGNNPSIPTPALIPARISPPARLPVPQGLPPLLPPPFRRIPRTRNRCNRGKSIRLPFPVLPSPITIRPPAPPPARWLSAPSPPYPSLMMAPGFGSSTTSIVSRVFRPLLWSGSLSIDRDRLAHPRVGILVSGAPPTYSCILIN